MQAFRTPELSPRRPADTQAVGWLHCNHPQPRPPFARRHLSLQGAAGTGLLRLAARASARDRPSAVHRVPRPCPPRWSEPYPARAAKGGAASGGACGPRWAGDIGPKVRIGDQAAGRMPGDSLAGGAPRAKPPSSLAAKLGSDEGGGPGNGAGLRQNFRVTGA
jgi:hypothetical protein